MKKLYYNLNKCLGCKSCEIACAIGHSRSKDIFAAIYEETISKPRVKVASSKKRPFPLSCRHCEDAKCIDACMSGALIYDEQKGVVIHNEDKCVGCWMCIMVCPYGSIRPNRQTKIPLRCDLCINEDKPRCVEACPTGAIFFGEEEEFMVETESRPDRAQ